MRSGLLRGSTNATSPGLCEILSGFGNSISICHVSLSIRSAIFEIQELIAIFPMQIYEETEIGFGKFVKL